MRRRIVSGLQVFSIAVAVCVLLGSSRLLAPEPRGLLTCSYECLGSAADGPPNGASN
jgi:hypothetical protein